MSIYDSYITPRKERTPTTCAGETLIRLCGILAESVPANEIMPSIRDLIDSVYRDDSISGDNAAKDLFDMVRAPAGPIDNILIAMHALYVALLYCIQAMKADDEGDQRLAWTFVADANLWAGRLVTSHSSAKKVIAVESTEKLLRELMQLPVFERRKRTLREWLKAKEIPSNKWLRLGEFGLSLKSIYGELKDFPAFQSNGAPLSFGTFERHFWKEQDVARISGGG